MKAKMFAGLPRFITALAAVISLASIASVLNERAARSEFLKQEILLKINRQPALEPLVVTPSGPGQIIVAGESTAGHRAWAIKIDAVGSILWSYTLGLLPEDLPFFTGLVDTPRFSGAVAMPDGTTFLCGSMPRPPRSQYSPGLLVHLDATGHAINTRYVLPSQRNEFGIARFSSCMRWRNGLAVAGSIWHTVRKGEENAPNAPGAAYWYMTTDGAERVISETQIRSSLSSGLFDIGPILSFPYSDSSLVFGASDNLTTELVRVKETGALEATKLLAGHFLLIRPVVVDDILQAYGSLLPDPTKKVVFGLDRELNETARVEGRHPTDFTAYLIFRMSDGSFGLFGSAKDALVDVFHSSIAHVAADLQSEEQADLPRNNIVDSPSIRAAAPTSDGSEFVVARTAILRDPKLRVPEDGTTTDFLRGAAVDVIDFK